MSKFSMVLLIMVMVITMAVPALASYGDYSLSDISFGEPYSYGSAINAVQLIKGTTTYQDGKPIAVTATQGLPSKLQIIDVETAELIEAIDIPDCKSLCWHVRTGPDGKVYFGDYNQCSLYCYDPETKEITILGKLGDGASAMVGLCFDEDGNIWMAGNPTTALYKYDIQTKTITKVLDKKTNNTVGLSITYHGGKIYYTVLNRPADTLYAYDIATGTEVTYPKPEGVKYFRYLQAKGNILMMNVTLDDDRNGLIAFDTRIKKFTKIIDRGMYDNRHFTPIINDKIYYTKAGYVWSYDIKKGTTSQTNMEYSTVMRGSDESLVEIDGYPGQCYVNFNYNGGISIWNFENQTVEDYMGMMEGSPSVLQICKMGSNGKFYVTQYMGTQALELDPKTGDKKYFPMAQATAFEIYDNCAYFGNYSEGNLYKLDLTKAYGSDNPVILDAKFMDEHQQRIHSSTLAGDKIAYGTFPEYNELGGSLTIFDPKTETMDIKRNIVPNQSVLGITYRDGKLYCGTSISGGLGINATETMPKIFIYDMATGQIIKQRDMNMIPGYQSSIKDVSGLTFTPDGELLGATYNVLFKLNPETLELIDYKVINPDIIYRADGQQIWTNTYFAYDEKTGFYFIKMHTDRDGCITILDPKTMEYVKTKAYGAHYPTFGTDGNLYYYDDIGDAVKLPVIRGGDKSYLLDNRVILRMGEPRAINDGEIVQIDGENPETRPFFCMGNLMLPIRFIGEIFGYNITWNDVENYALLHKETTGIKIHIGSRTIETNGESITAPVAPKTRFNRTFAHIRTMSDILGKRIYWNGLTNTLLINKTNGNISDDEINQAFAYADNLYAQN